MDPEVTFLGKIGPVHDMWVQRGGLHKQSSPPIGGQVTKKPQIALHYPSCTMDAEGDSYFRRFVRDPETEPVDPEDMVDA